MNDKFIWYKEILDIEPQSRLFLPLARILAGEGALEEAKAVLENGLSYHGHYVQARMLLSEVLQKLGRTDEAEQQFALVAGEFRENASFWETFAGTGTKNKDEAVIRRMLSLQLRNIPVEFSDILSRGLDSLEKEYGLEAGPAAEAEAERDTGKKEACRPGTSPADSPEKEKKQANTDTAGQEGSAAAGMTQAAAPVFEPSATFKPIVTVPHTISCSILRTVPQADGRQEKSVPAGSTTAQAEKPEIAAAAAHGTEKASPEASLKEIPLPDDSVQDFQDEADEPGLGWPPKTRSMAEVFVEQGEYAEAVSIYRELIARAESGEKAAELQKRLSEIQAMSGIDNESAGQAAAAHDAAPESSAEPQASESCSTQDNEAAAPAAGGSSDELLAMLENLASRVEARVR